MEVNIYVGVSSRYPKKKKRQICYILEGKANGRVETRGGEPETVTDTYHGATITAISKAMKRITGPCRITIYAEDAWTLHMMDTRMPEWERNGFRNRKGEPIPSQKEWMQVWLKKKEHDIRTIPGVHAYSNWMKEQMERRNVDV